MVQQVRCFRNPARRLVSLLLVAFVLLPGAAAAQTPPTPGPLASTNDAPVPITFPRDDGPHDALTEWWYYTGHLFTEEGARYGFEFVVFKARRGLLEGHVAHFAVTDNPRQRFRYDQRIVSAENVSTPAPGFALAIGDWSMRGANGDDALRASMPGYAIDLALESSKPAVLHDGDGYITYGDGTASYYYSRTRLTVTGSLTVDGERQAVTGDAWMDHQWGDFETFEDGGWDWFALQFDDQTELMLYLIRDETGRVVLVDGSLVDADGNLTVLDGDDVTLRETASWTSPRTGVTYPAGWTVTLPAADLAIDLTPSLAGQELDTTATTGVIYWEGEVLVAARRAGQPLTGLGYVELTGYASRQIPPSLQNERESPDAAA